MTELYRLYQWLFNYRYRYWIACPYVEKKGDTRYYRWSFWDDSIEKYRSFVTQAEAEDIINRYPEMKAVRFK